MDRVRRKAPGNLPSMHNLRDDINAVRMALSKFEAERPTNLKMKAPYDRALAMLRTRLAEFTLVAQENMRAKDHLATLQSIEEVGVLLLRPRQ